MIKKRRFNYLFYAAIVIALLFSLLYEVFEPRSVENIAMVSGVGLEKGENETIKLSVQIIKPTFQDTEAQGIVFTGEGSTVIEATEQIVLKTGSLLFWSHCAVMIINENLAQEDMVGHLDFFFRVLNYRNMVPIFISDKSPEEVLNSTVMFESISAFGIQKLLEDLNQDTNSVYTNMNDFMTHYYDVGGSTVVAGITLAETGEGAIGQEQESSQSENTESEENAMVELSDCAVISKGRLAGYLNTSELMGYNWLNNDVKTRSMVIENVEFEEGVNSGTVSIAMFNLSAKIVPQQTDGKWKMRVKIKGKAEILSVENGVDFTKKSAAEVERMTQRLNDLIQEKIQAEIESAWDKMEEYECDFCGINKLFYSKYGNRWDGQPKTDSMDFLENVELDYEVKFSVVTESMNKRFDD